MVCMQTFTLVWLLSLSELCLRRESQNRALREPMPVRRLHASIWSSQLALCAGHPQQPDSANEAHSYLRRQVLKGVLETCTLVL